MSYSHLQVLLPSLVGEVQSSLSLSSQPADVQLAAAGQTLVVESLNLDSRTAHGVTGQVVSLERNLQAALYTGVLGECRRLEMGTQRLVTLTGEAEPFSPIFCHCTVSLKYRVFSKAHPNDGKILAQMYPAEEKSLQYGVSISPPMRTMAFADVAPWLLAD